MMSPEEFDKRGEDRRMNRYPPPTDRITLVIGVALFVFVVIAIVWGLT